VYLALGIEQVVKRMDPRELDALMHDGNEDS
jgi:hypothetical protein